MMSCRPSLTFSFGEHFRKAKNAFFLRRSLECGLTCSASLIEEKCTKTASILFKEITKEQTTAMTNALELEGFPKSNTPNSCKSIVAFSSSGGLAHISTSLVLAMIMIFTFWRIDYFEILFDDVAVTYVLWKNFIETGSKNNKNRKKICVSLLKTRGADNCFDVNRLVEK